MDRLISYIRYFYRNIFVQVRPFNHNMYAFDPVFLHKYIELNQGLRLYSLTVSEINAYLVLDSFQQVIKWSQQPYNKRSTFAIFLWHTSFIQCFCSFGIFTVACRKRKYFEEYIFICIYHVKFSLLATMSFIWYGRIFENTYFSFS